MVDGPRLAHAASSRLFQPISVGNLLPKNRVIGIRAAPRERLDPARGCRALDITRNAVSNLRLRSRCLDGCPVEPR
jgi:hypothetical protein